MKKEEVFEGFQIYYESFLWGGQYIVLAPKGSSNYKELHRFNAIEEARNFITDNLVQPRTWYERLLG